MSPIRLNDLPADVQDRIRASLSPKAPNPAFRPQVLVQRPGQMNSLEEHYADYLCRLVERGEIFSWYYEAFKLRLAHRTFYTPDFLVVNNVTPFPLLCFHEVKGFMRDDAAVKVKVAAETYPEFGFVVVRATKGGGWDCERIPRSREPEGD